MALTVDRRVLADMVAPPESATRLVRQALLVALGIAFMAAMAKIRVPMWPVPITMQTFGVLTIGAVYGARLGLVTLLGYLVLGAAGIPLFTGEGAGLAYMAGPTGGYLVGFAVAAFVVGALARNGWSRSVGGMIGALVIGNVIVYAFGMPWMAYLFLAEKGAAWVWQWGMGNFLLGDALKLLLAALIVPGLWRIAPARR